jgi:hypothetical protein
MESSTRVTPSARILESPNGVRSPTIVTRASSASRHHVVDGADDADASETRTATELADRRWGRRLDEIEGRVVVRQEGRAPLLVDFVLAVVSAYVVAVLIAFDLLPLL